MWTYMMAAARGDRASSILSSRRRADADSPRLSGPIYGLSHRIPRANGPNGGAGSLCSSYQYPYNNHQMFHTTYNVHANPTPITPHEKLRDEDEQEILFGSVSGSEDNELPSHKFPANHIGSESTAERGRTAIGTGKDSHKDTINGIEEDTPVAKIADGVLPTGIKNISGVGDDNDREGHEGVLEDGSRLQVRAVLFYRLA
ncbi:unnamed protein product [Hermetia illucens]|uniref:Uncharacterized protein n=1 Tax=Hermetia illucens TaxID=343691 RepID=A0A7R8YKT9_HERIL|nr:unnamed protein product [Hermetia illucens]